MCLGRAQNADLPGPDVSAPRSVLGGKKAAVAVAHKILVIVYHLLTEGTVYDEERYDRLQPRQEAQQRQRALKMLERLGYHVHLERVA